MDRMTKLTKLITVEPVLFLHTVAVLLEISILQDFIRQKVCLQEFGIHNSSVCKHLDKYVIRSVQDSTVIWVRYYNVVLNGCGLLACTYLGSWGDRFGRKIPLVIPPLGSVLSCVNFIIVTTYIYKGHVSLLLVSAVLSGFSGGTIAMAANSFGYLSDITTEGNRTLRTFILEAMLFVGGTTGLYIGGTMLRVTSYSSVFLLELSLCVVDILYILFCLKDIKPIIENQLVKDSSQPAKNSNRFVKDSNQPVKDSGQPVNDSNRSAKDSCQPVKDSKQSVKDTRGVCQKLFGIDHVLDMLKTTLKQRPQNKRKYILLVGVATTLAYYGLEAQLDLLYIFVTDDPLLWDQRRYSYFSGLNFGLSGVFLLVGLPLTFRWFQIPDALLGVMGTLSRGLGLAMLSLSTTTPMVLICPALLVFSEYAVPAARSIQSKLVEEDERGKIFAFLAVMQNVCFLTGPLIFNSLYPVTATFFKGFPFALAALFEFIAVIIFVYLFKEFKSKPSLLTEIPHDTIKEEPV